MKNEIKSKIIISIPTLLVFRNGEVAERSVGAVPKEKILEMLK